MKMRLGNCSGCAGFSEDAVTTPNRWKIQTPRERTSVPSVEQRVAPVAFVDFAQDGDREDFDEAPPATVRPRSRRAWLPVLAALAALAVAMAFLRP